MAAGLAGTDVQIGAMPTRAANAAGLGRRGSGNGQALHLGLHLVAHRGVERAVPARLQRLHPAFRVELLQQAAQRSAYRQALGQVSQRGQIQTVGLEFAAGHRMVACDLVKLHGLGLVPLQRELARRPDLAVGGGKRQAIDRQLHAAARALRDKTPAELGKSQRRQIPRQPSRHLAQRNIQGQRLRQALIPVNPSPQRGLALLQIHWQIDMVAQTIDIDPRQVGVEHALPLLPVSGARQQGAADLSPQTQTLAPVRRRRGIQPEFVTPPLVAHHQQQVGQLQGWCLTLFVDPAQQAAADDHFMLLKEPVGRSAAVYRSIGRRHIQPRHMPMPLGIAAHLKPGVLDQQLLEAQAQAHQGRHRKRGRDLRQPQSLATPRIAQHHIAQHKRRHPARAVHRDLADLHRMPERATRLRLDHRTPFVKTGQNQPVQGQPGQHQAGPSRHQQSQR